MEQTILVWGPTRIFGNEYCCPLWPVWSFWSVGPKCTFPFDKILSPVPLFSSLLTRTITKRAVAWVEYVQPECTVRFPKFQIGIFVEWKAPEIMWCDLPLKRISFAVWLVTLAPIQIFWYFAPSSMSFSGSFYVSVKLPTYPSPKPKFCPK